MNADSRNNSAAVERLLAISTEKALNLFEAGYTSQAIEFYRDILSTLPENHGAMLTMAKMYKKTGKTDEALPLLWKIPQESFCYADALFTLGLILMDKRDFEGGMHCFKRLINLDDLHVEGYNNLAMCLMELGQPEEAQKFLFQSLRISPEYGKTHLYLGNLFARYWRLGEAREQFQHVLELHGDNVGAYSNLSGIAVLEGNIAEAVALLHSALRLKPNYCIAADNLLLNMNYSDQYSPEQIRDEHFRLADIYRAVAQKNAFHHQQYGKKIRVGYVSGDFRSHSVAFFLEPVLLNHNKNEYEILCYDMVTAPDDTTRRMMGLGWTWRPVYGLSDNTVADQILSDGIDILVDLSGHTQGNRLGVFAMRPAPVQVTWLGYPNTTGLKQIDYRLTDNLTDPPGMTDQLYSERLARLPHSFLCYAPPASAPQVAPLPSGPITFCCFNNYPKISDTVLTLWARILIALPDSRFLLKCGSLEDVRVRTQLTGRFATLGVDPSRILLDRFTIHREEHLQRYGACHIALDTYPYNGTTTTCEALWMGVPVVTLAGRTHASRVGLSLLENSALHELIARNSDQYVEIAVKLALDSERLLKYRLTLRRQLSCSPLTDAVRFTRDLETIYRKLISEITCHVPT
jgi:predicted O-linked N-acetylglucosamine transferase (SPINDLY family)